MWQMLAQAHACAPSHAVVVLNLALLKKKISSSASRPFFLRPLCAFCSCVGPSLFVSPLPGCLFYSQGDLFSVRWTLPTLIFLGSRVVIKFTCRCVFPFPHLPVLQLPPTWARSVFQPRMVREAALQNRCRVRSGVP